MPFFSKKKEDLPCSTLEQWHDDHDHFMPPSFASYTEMFPASPACREAGDVTRARVLATQNGLGATTTM